MRRGPTAGRAPSTCCCADRCDARGANATTRCLERAGILRARFHTHRLKSRLAASLIAQSCLDHNLALITRDRDFRHFARHGGLRLALRR